MAALYTIGAFAIIFDTENRVLLCHRRDMDLWNLPGGGVESGELPTEAVVREVKEETGLDVVVQRLVGVYGKPDKDDLVFAFACDVVGGEVTETDESDACRYFAVDAAPPNTSLKQLARMRDALSSDAQPLFRRQAGPSSRVWLQMLARYRQQLGKVFELQRKIVDVHPLLQELHPIAIVVDDQFYVFDTDAVGRAYVFVKQAPTPMPVPKGVRASFPLACYDDRPACVITDDAFDTLADYVTIFHEFVHCYQSEMCESQLKETLGVAQRAKAEGDMMWEINYPFPYTDPAFVDAYASFLDATVRGQEAAIRDCRATLQRSLSAFEFEYMVWQEWKEGLARYVENRIRQRLGLDENHGGARQPFDRVTFYEGGARFIAFLLAQEPDLALDIKALFFRIQGENLPGSCVSPSKSRKR